MHIYMIMEYISYSAIVICIGIAINFSKTKQSKVGKQISVINSLEEQGLLFLDGFFHFPNDFFIDNEKVFNMNQCLLFLNKSYSFLTKEQIKEIERITKETKRIINEFSSMNSANKEDLHDKLDKKMISDILKFQYIINVIQKRCYEKSYLILDNFQTPHFIISKRFHFIKEKDDNPKNEKRRIALINIKNKELKYKKNKILFSEIQYKISLINEFLECYDLSTEEVKKGLISHLSRILQGVNILIDRMLEDESENDKLKRKLDRELLKP